MKLFYETPEHYLAFCRMSVVTQLDFIHAVDARLRQHQEQICNTSSDCEFCNSLLDAILEQNQILDVFNERLEKAKKGMYE